jgi:hypothetical protein
MVVKVGFGYDIVFQCAILNELVGSDFVLGCLLLLLLCYQYLQLLDPASELVLALGRCEKLVGVGLRACGQGLSFGKALRNSPDYHL